MNSIGSEIKLHHAGDGTAVDNSNTDASRRGAGPALRCGPTSTGGAQGCKLAAAAGSPESPHDDEDSLSSRSRRCQSRCCVLLLLLLLLSGSDGSGRVARASVRLVSCPSARPLRSGACSSCCFIFFSAAQTFFVSAHIRSHKLLPSPSANAMLCFKSSYTRRGGPAPQDQPQPSRLPVQVGQRHTALLISGCMADGALATEGTKKCRHRAARVSARRLARQAMAAPDLNVAAAEPWTELEQQLLRYPTVPTGLLPRTSANWRI